MCVIVFVSVCARVLKEEECLLTHKLCTVHWVEDRLLKSTGCVYSSAPDRKLAFVYLTPTMTGNWLQTGIWP